MKLSFITIDSAKLRPGKLLKQISIFILVAIIAIFNCGIPVRASEPTATPGSSSSGEYVTIDVPLTWTLNKNLNFDTGEEVDSTNASVTGYINIIPGASYSVSIVSPGSGYNSGAFSYYYRDLNYLNYQELWNTTTGQRTVALRIPSEATTFRLVSGLIIDADNSQNIVNMSITVSATYLEENNLTEEAVLDLVYRDENSIISDTADDLSVAFDDYVGLEDSLLNDASVPVDDYLDSFNLDTLSEFESGFAYVALWFGNFFNSSRYMSTMIGCAAGLTIVFILLRFRGK